jgi:hypothetical protein
VFFPIVLATRGGDHQGSAEAKEIRMSRTSVVVIPLVTALVAAGCGQASKPCSVTQAADGSATISCPDGSHATLPANAGSSCSVADHGDGTATLACSDGTTAVIPGRLPKTVHGSITVASSLDLMRLVGVEVIEGDLAIQRMHGLTELSLPSLRRVEGQLQINGQDTVTRLALPVLTYAGGLMVDTGDVLTSFEMPLLERVGDLKLYWQLSVPRLELPALASVGQLLVYVRGSSTVSLPALTTVDHSFDFAGSMDGRLLAPKLAHVEHFGVSDLRDHATFELPALATVDGQCTIGTISSDVPVALPSLTVVGGTLTLNQNVVSFTAPELTRVGALQIYALGGDVATNLPKLATVDNQLEINANSTTAGTPLPKLATVGTNFLLHDNLWPAGREALTFPALTSVGELLRLSSDTATSLSLPALTTTKQLEIRQNGALTALTLPLLATVAESLVIVGNHELRDCVAEGVGRLASQGGVPATFQITDNGGREGCPGE